MPFYEYVCSACGAETEVLQKLSDPPETECPACHANDLEQLLSGFAVSSDGSRQASALAARRSAVTSSDFRDQKVAHAEYVKKHADE